MCQGPFLYTRSYVNMGLDTVRECTKKCFELEECEFFTYDPRDVYCYFHAEAVGCELVEPKNSGATVYRIYRSPETESPAPEMSSKEVATISWYNPGTCKDYACESVGDDLGVWSRGCILHADNQCKPKCDEVNDPAQCREACVDWCNLATQTCRTACSMGSSEVATISWYNDCNDYACESVGDDLGVWYRGCLLAAENMCKPKCDEGTDPAACKEACGNWCLSGIQTCRTACVASPVISSLERTILP